MNEEKKKEEPKVELVDVDLNEEQLKDKRRFLEQCKLSKEETDIEVEKQVAQLDNKIPKRMMDDMIDEIKKDIKNKKIRRRKEDGTESYADATEADLALLKIELESLQKSAKADLPMRSLRLKISNMRKQKEAIDAPDQQIHKLEKEIKRRKATVPQARAGPPQMVG